MTEPTNIRKIGAAELGIVDILAQRIWPDTYKNTLSEEQIRYMMHMMYSPTSLQDQVTNKGHQFILIERGTVPLGFASFSASGLPGIFRLHRIYVLQELQGSGLGKALLEFVEKEIRKLSGTALELNVNRTNKARQFYERLGFSVIREEDIDIGNGYFMNDYVMRKSL